MNSKATVLVGASLIAGFVAGIANIFAGHFVNSYFLALNGEASTAKIILEKQTSVKMSDTSFIVDYDVAVQSKSGAIVLAKLDTSSLAIYPLRNQILVPPQGESFVVKFIPGVEKNFVIMSDESNYGRQRIIADAWMEVQEKAALCDANSQDEKSRNEYREALQEFRDRYKQDLDTSRQLELQKKLDALNQPR